MKYRSPVAILLFLLLLVSPLAWSQFAQRGGIEGTVFDPSGAVLPGAQVTLLDLAQRQTRELKSDASGHFEFSNLAAGQYQLTAALQGFGTTNSAPISVNIGALTHFDFKLRPETVQQSVTVSEESAGLETDTTSIDTKVTTQQFEDLPLNGRNFTSIAALAPGVSTYPQANINPGGTYSVGAMFAMGGTQFTAGGSFQGSRDSGFYVNGVNINDNYESSISYEPSAEALGAGTVQVADFSAAIGHDIAALTMQTKGGSSKFHGEAFEFFENTALNAVNPWDHANQIITGQPAIKPVLHRNQFGGNLGGPIYIPKLLPQLRDKLFFFANYEKMLESDGNSQISTSVPSAAERTGDFSELLPGGQLYNPYTTTYDPETGASIRQPIPGNRMDLATKPDGSPLIDPNAANVINALYPLPNVANVPSSEVNYVTYQSQGISQYHLDTRFDAKITNNDSLFVTWSKSDGSNTFGGGLQPTNLYSFPVADQAFLVTTNYVHIFTPNLTNEFIFGVGDGALVTMSPSQFSWTNSSSNPLNNLFQNTGDGITKGVFAVYASNAGNGYATPGAGEVFRAENESYQYSDNLDWIHGRHSITAGFNFFRKSEIDWDIARDVSFGGFSASGSDLGHQGGDGMADLLMGLPSDMWVRYTITGGTPTSPDYNIIFPSWGFYVNDKFRWTPKLTVAAGLRYELSIPNYTPNPAIAPCCAIYEATSDGGILKYPGIAPGLSNRYLSAPKGDFAPRVSIAYSFNPRRVVRAGYGIFYNTGASQISNNVGNAIYGTSAAVNYSVNNTTLGAPFDTPVLNLSNIFPAPQSTSLGSFPVSTGPGQGYQGDGQYASITYYDQKSMPLPYYQRMMLDLQQQIGAHDVFTLSYAGAQGRKGQQETNINLPAYQTGWVAGGGVDDPAFNAARPNNAGRFGDIYVMRPRINSFYNALIVQYRHDFSRGFQMSSNYTWGKTVSDYPWVNTLSNNGTSGGGMSGFQYPNLYNRGESNQSHRHRFVFSGIWEPKYGANWSAWMKEPFAGWRLSGIITLESGDALTVQNGGPNSPCSVVDSGTAVCPTGFGSSAQDGAGFDELNVSGNANIGHSSKTFSRQFNTAKFSVPAQGTRGNSGLGTVRGPGQSNVDLSLSKQFPIYDRLHIEFRADAFNALNHSQWTGVNTIFPSGSDQYPFGQVKSAREARITQLAAKVVF